AIEWTDATRGIVPGILRGMGKQRKAATINIGSYYFAVLPLGILAVFVLNKGIIGLWIAFSIGMSILSGSYIYLISRTDWDKEVEQCTARILNEV
ncbi:hypothetical protein GGF48_005781, partial [Coemansia sp. RSA 921]